MEVPGDRSLSVRAVAGTFAALAWISMSLRCYVRLKIVNFFGWDDAFMIVALAFYTTFSALMITAGTIGTGKHEANLTPEAIVTALRLWWLCEVSYCLASVTAKISICLFLLRIVTIRRIQVRILHSVMAVTTLTGIVFMFILLLQCHPISFFWNKEQDGHCIGWNVIIAMSWVWSILAGSCDFTVGILPIFLVWNLNMDRRSKIGVASILGLAAIASSAVIIRFPFLHTFADPDFLWATTDLAIWTNIEVGLGILASSLATLRPLLRVINGQAQHAFDEYQSSDRLQYERSTSNGTLSSQFVDQDLDSQPQLVGINVVNPPRITGGDYNGCEDHLNPATQIRNPNREYLVQKSFEVTAVETV